MVQESPTRNAAWVSSGDIPTAISIGTMIGESSAHFADAEPISRLTAAVRTIIPMMVASPGSAIAFRPSAPASATSVPMLESLKALINIAQKKAITI
ncbi:hypothetical protein D3C75_890390 [compost metagenome]